MKAPDDTRWLEEIDKWGPSREALLFEGESLSFADLAEEVRITRSRLSAAGISAGERVGMLARPSRSGFVLIHALLDSGAIMVPLNLRWTVAELRATATSARLRWLVVADDTVEIGENLAGALGFGLLLLSTRGPSAEGIDCIRHPVLRDREEGRIRREEMPGRNIALILFTSGTSGRPKGAMISHRNLRASAEASIEMLGSETGDRWLCCMPLFHIGGLSILIRSVLAGTSVALHRSFDAKRVSEALDADRITRISVVTTMLAQLVEWRGERGAPASLRLVLLGGGPASQDLLGRARDLGYPVAPSYGLTEAASQVATRPPAFPMPPGEDLCGRLQPLPGTEIRIVHSTRTDADESSGEIEVRGPTIMSGYLDDPEATREVLRDGWLATGDLGRLDADGGLRVLDRRSDLIVSGGENVYPAEIESLLAEHRDVEEAGVVGIENEVYGQRPLAFLVAVGGRPIDTADLEAFCVSRLAKFKVPVAWVVVDRLPRTTSGKILRRELKSRAASVARERGL